MQHDDSMMMIHECFVHYDMNKKGYLIKNELKYAMTALLGSTPTKLVLCQLFNIIENEYDTIRITYDIFHHIMIQQMNKIDITELIRRWFKAFDLNSSGFISMENMKQVCTLIAPHMKVSVIFQLFNQADMNHDEKISYTEFERMILLSIQHTKYV